MPAPHVSDIEAIEARLTSSNSPFALSNIFIDGYSCSVFSNGPQTLTDIYRKARHLEQKPFIVRDDVHMTYGNVFREAKRLSAFLMTHFDVGRGAGVAICLENGPEWIIAFLAITLLGASAVLVPDLDVTSLRTSQICTRTRFAIMRGGKKNGIFISEAGANGLETTISFPDIPDGSENQPWPHIYPDDESIVAFTSGTTGLPKGIILTHRGVVTGLQNMMLAGALSSYQDRERTRAMNRPFSPCILMLSPLSHISGYGQFLLMLMLGGKLVFPDAQTPHELLAVIEREKVTSIAGATPAKVRELLRNFSSPQAVRSLVSLNMTGVAPPATLVEEIKEKIPHILFGSGYGMTETNGALSAISGDQLFKRPGSSGRLVSSVECRIVDNRGTVLNKQEFGEIWVRGAMTMRGYWDNKPNGLESGWLKTGDIGYLSPDRHLYLTDRCARSPENAICRDIERFALDEPAIDEVAAFCVDWETENKLFIGLITKENAAFDSERWKRQLMTAVMDVPANARIVLLSEFPRTRSGKVDNNLLRERIKLWDGQC